MKFYEVLNYWSWDDSCNVSLTSIDVVFSASQTTKFYEWLLIRENPGSDQVLGASAQRGNPAYVSYYNNQPWGGYQFYGNVYQTANVWESLATWSIPTPNEGYSGQCNNSTNYNENSNCQLAVWTGITHGMSGSYMAQAGTASTLECMYSGSNYLCTRLYQLWTEFFPQLPVYCTLSGIQSGDSMYVYALNQAVNPGGNSNLYNIYVGDTTANKACSVSNYNFSQMGIPHYAEFMIETPGSCPEPPGSVETSFGCGFPKFATFPMTGNLYYSGAMNGIYVPYQNGWYNTYQIQNCVYGGGCYYNSNFGSVDSSNAFNQIWLTSLDTY